MDNRLRQSGHCGGVPVHPAHQPDPQCPTAHRRGQWQPAVSRYPHYHRCCQAEERQTFSLVTVKLESNFPPDQTCSVKTRSVVMLMRGVGMTWSFSGAPDGRGRQRRGECGWHGGTGDHDDRVVPLHSHKLTATLQHVLCYPGSPQTNPLITRIEVSCDSCRLTHTFGQNVVSALNSHTSIARRLGEHAHPCCSAELGPGSLEIFKRHHPDSNSSCRYHL